MTAKFNPNPRRRARRLALQALYQWMLSGNDLVEIEHHSMTENDMAKVDADYFHRLLHDIPAQLEKIDKTFEGFLDRDKDVLNPIELTTLRMGTYELLNCPDIPFKVSINEAVGLTKKFGTVDGYKYVNAVLDKVAKVVSGEV